MVLIFGVFYLIVVRPMRKKQLQTETMLGQLKNGDRVLTSGGIYGTVVGVSDDQVQLRVADHVKIQVAKSAVTQLVEESADRP
jgi:preprotein translocase subunit YajC